MELSQKLNLKMYNRQGDLKLKFRTCLMSVRANVFFQVLHPIRLVCYIGAKIQCVIVLRIEFKLIVLR